MAGSLTFLNRHGSESNGPTTKSHTSDKRPGVSPLGSLPVTMVGNDESLPQHRKLAPMALSKIGMRSLILSITLGLVACPAQAAEVQLGSHTFTLPDGFEIEPVAGPPLVNRPICADFDEQGRLYVADSSGSNDNVQVQLQERPHRIVRLEDTDGDGQFETSVVFAEKMMFPEGALWYDGSLYVAAPPEIWKLTDTDDDGRSDRREVWFDGKTLTGCANDLHGPYLGPDGWIYWCKGAFAQQTYDREDAPPFETRAAHIFRRRPEGGPVEPVMTGGMDNPVEVVFTPGGERIFTTTFFQHPGNGLRDGLIHAIYGGVYGKIHGVLEGHPRTGDIMPVLTHMGAAAPCGLVRLESGHFGDHYRDNILACQFNMQKVSRHTLTPKGASFDCRDEDFLVSDNLDFHPTDVIEDADGSLLVVDTGGWYKLCCPTSNLSKPDILGSIYRIRRSGAQQVDDPRGVQIAWSSLSLEELTQLLADPRVAVRNRAKQILGQRGVPAVAALRRVLTNADDVAHRLQAVWTLSLIDDRAARLSTRKALSDNDEQVRQAAIHCVSAWKDEDAAADMLLNLKTNSVHNRRAAAEALGRIGASNATASLLAASAGSTGRALEHSLVYALIEIADAEGVRAAIAHANPQVRRSALIALDQMPGGNLQPKEVVPLLGSTDATLRETGWWIADHHSEWAPQLAEYFRTAIPATTVEAQALQQLSSRLARFAADATVGQVMAASLADDALSDQTRVAVIDAMASSGLTKLPQPWSQALDTALEGASASVLEAVVKAVARLSGSNLSQAFTRRLQNIAADDRLLDHIRLRSLVALPPARRGIDGSVVLRFLCDRIAVENAVEVRALAVDVLLSTPLNASQVETVAAATAHSGPMELKRLMQLFGKHTGDRIGAQLVASLQQCPAASSLPLDELRRQLAEYGNEVLGQAETLLARIERENAAKYDKLESILELVHDGDIRRGQRVFRDTKVACTACHTMGYLGGRAGPDLTRIGRIRSERDLLEAILFPSASFVRSFEPVSIVTADGKVHNGVILDETASEIVLQLDPNKTRRIPIDEIEERVAGTVSIMPVGLDNQLTPRQLADLVTFLKASQ